MILPCQPHSSSGSPFIFFVGVRGESMNEAIQCSLVLYYPRSQALPSLAEMSIETTPQLLHSKAKTKLLNHQTHIRTSACIIHGGHHASTLHVEHCRTLPTSQFVRLMSSGWSRRPYVQILSFDFILVSVLYIACVSCFVAQHYNMLCACMIEMPGSQDQTNSLQMQ